MARKKQPAPDDAAPLPATVDRRALAQALAVFKPLARGPLAVLRHVLLETAGESLLIRGTDLDLSLQLAVPLLEPAGQLAPTLIELDRLLGFVKSSWSEAVTLSRAEDALLAEAGVKARFKLALTADDFPTLPLPLRPVAGGMELGRDIWAAVEVAAGFTNPKRGGDITDRIFLLGEDPDKHLLAVYGLHGHTAYRRTGMVMPGIANGRIELTPEAVRLLGGLEWDTVRVADDVENHILVEGPGFLFAQRRLETDLFQPGNFWGADNFRETRIAELLPALEALAELQEQAGDKKAVRKAVLAIEPDGDGAKATVTSDTASGEALLAGHFPSLQTFYGADLCRALRAVDRGGAVQIGELTRAGTGVRIDAEDGSSVLISGIGQR